MTETNPLPGAGMERAVEAALDEWFNKDSEIVYWRSADLSNFYRAQMRRAIAAADRARGRSYITWRKPEEYEQSPSRWVFIRRELAVDRLPPETFHTGGNLLHANVIAFAEMPAPPAWSDTLARTATDDAAPAHADLHPPSTHETPGAAVLAGGESFQEGVHKWLLACFGPEIAADKIERNHRFLEEALELVQSAGCTDSEAHQLVDYVFSRPVGEIEQEIGGVMNTLAALCLAHGFDMMAAGDKEMRRVWTMVEKIRAKQATKPRHSPLPEHTLPDESTLPRTNSRLELMRSLAPRDLPPAEREAWAKHRLRELDVAWVLVDKDSAAFVDALLIPPEPNDALREAAKRYKYDDIAERITGLEQDGGHMNEELMTQGARIAALEVLLKRVAEIVRGHARRDETWSELGRMIHAAFPEPGV